MPSLEKLIPAKIWDINCCRIVGRFSTEPGISCLLLCGFKELLMVSCNSTRSFLSESFSRMINCSCFNSFLALGFELSPEVDVILFSCFCFH